MSAEKTAKTILPEEGRNTRAIFRYAFGSAFLMMVAMGFGWQVSFLTPVLALSFLGSPVHCPSFSQGIFFVIAIAVAATFGVLLSRFFLPYPPVYIPLVWLILLHIFYATPAQLPAFLKVFLMIAVSAIPLLNLQSLAVATGFAFSLVVNGLATVVLVWIVYAIFPDKAASGSDPAAGKTAAKPSFPGAGERFRTALISTIVVFPVLLMYYYFEWVNSLTVLIFILILTMQPGFAKDFKAGAGLLFANFLGGMAAIVIYELLVIVPLFPFMVLLILLAGLFFGRQLFSGKPAAALFGSAFSTVLLIIGMTTSSQSDADSKVYTRLVQISIAVIYVVVASGIISELFKRSGKPRLRLFGRATVIVVLSLSLSSCLMGPDYTRPLMESPSTYRSDSIPGISIANLPWWELYGDTTLQNLIWTALENNRDFQGSLARIQDARLNLSIVQANLYPQINYAVEATAGLNIKDGVSTSASITPILDVSYQVDLWGRISRMNEAALQEYLATEEALRSLTIAIIAEVAEAYLLLRDLDNRLLISENTARTWEENLDIVQSRLRAGMVSEVDLNQAKIQLAEARVSIQTFNRLRAQTENGISALLALPPQSIARGLPLNEQVLSPEVPAGLPSELLDRRPDLMESEAKLHAQTARIGIAEALKYPQLILSADMGAQFANPTLGFANLGAQLFGPLFNSGANKKRVEQEIARTRQLLHSYEQIFLTALREVEDAMIAVQTFEAEYRTRLEQVEAANLAERLTWTRYENGLNSYLEVLDLQRSQFSSQLKASEALQLRLTSTVRLYQALGGGWYTE